MIVVFEFCFPHRLQAKEIGNSLDLGPVSVQIMAQGESIKDFPAINKAPRIVRWVTVTAYSSTVEECDDTPFITANGKWVYDGLIAANFLKFGTTVKFPDYFGDKVFTVDDRMNSKYNSRLDIWMSNREQALMFGVRYLKVEIY